MPRAAGKPRSLLTAFDAKMIKQLIAERERHLEIASNLTDRKIAEKFEVSHKTIESIRNGKSWRDA